MAVSTPAPQSSAAAAMAYALLRQYVHRHIDEAEFLATMTVGWSARDVETARALIPDLTDAVRHVLRLHPVGGDGACSGCGQSWPCPSFTAVYEVLTDPQRRIAGLCAERRG